MIQTMPGNLQPLDEKFAITGADGRPTQYFIRWAQQRQIDIGEAISAVQALEIVEQFLADHPLIAGSGINLAPSGNIADDVTISADVQAILDQITTTRGSILYRGVADWLALAPGTSGQFLKTNGAGADPEWSAAGGGGGGSSFLPMAQESGIDFTVDSAAFGPPLLFLTQGIAGFAQTITGVRVPMRAIGSGYTLEPCLYGGIDPATTTPSPSGATRVALGPGVALTTANTIYSLPFTTPVVLTPGLVYYLGFSAHGGTGNLSLAALGSNRVEYFNSGTFNPPPNPAPSMNTFVANNCGWWAY
jgi:hypothetical protein